MLGIFDENLNTVARELGVLFRVEGCRIAFEGEDTAVRTAADVVTSLVFMVISGEQIEKGRLLY